MLRLLLGKDWKVLRRKILSEVSGNVAARQEGAVLIVPELISHEMERALCAAAGDTASRYAEVLSFSRLCRAVAEEVGCAGMQCLDNGGRVVAMAAAARQLSSRLKAYAALESKPEFLKELVDAVDEFKRCCITPEELKAAAARTAGSLAQKLEELGLLMESYDSLCAQGRRDPRDQMTWLLERLEVSAGECTLYEDSPGACAAAKGIVAVRRHVFRCKIAAAAAIADGDFRNGDDRHAARRGDRAADNCIDVDHVLDLAHGSGHHIRQRMFHNLHRLFSFVQNFQEPDTGAQRKGQRPPDGDRGHKMRVYLCVAYSIIERGPNVTLFYDEKTFQGRRDGTDGSPCPAITHGSLCRIVAAADVDIQRQLVHTKLAPQIAERIKCKIEQLYQPVHTAGKQRIWLFLLRFSLCRCLFCLLLLLRLLLFLFGLLRQKLEQKRPDLCRKKYAFRAISRVNANGDTADQHEDNEDRKERHPPCPRHSGISCCTGADASGCAGSSCFCSSGSTCEGSTCRSTFSISGSSDRDSRPNTRKKSGVVS